MPLTDNPLFSRVLIEGCSAESLTPNLRGALEAAGLLNAGTVAVSGVIRAALDTGLTIVLPKGFGNRLGGEGADRVDKLQDIFLTIRVINRCLKERRFQSQYVDSGFFWPLKSLKETQILDAVEAAFMLLQDFEKNGFFWQKNSLRRMDDFAHPVNWNRTFDVFPPEIDIDEFSFRRTIHSARVREPRDFIHRLHATCLEDISSILGLKQSIADGRRLREAEIDLVSRQPDAVILPLLSRTYRERGRMLLKLMLAWFRGRLMFGGRGANSQKVYGFCCNFNCVWEYMIRELLDNVGIGGRVLESGRWQPVGLELEESTGSPEIDLRRIVTSSAGRSIDCIIDAKDKRMASTGRSGSAGDHYKQIIYGLLSNNNRTGRLFNVLMFPSTGGSSPITLLGRHRWAGIEGSEVFEATADLRTVAESWLKGSGESIRSAFDMIAEKTSTASID